MTETRPLTFTELVRAYQAGIWRYLRYLGCDAAEADDLTQETFLAVMNKPFDQRSDGQTAGYLRTVARHKFLRARQRAGRSVPVADLDVADEVFSTLASDGGQEMLDALDECLEELTDRARAAIDLRYRENQSRAEIGRQLDLTEDGVKTLLRRTRNTLRQCVEGKINSL